MNSASIPSVAISATPEPQIHTAILKLPSTDVAAMRHELANHKLDVEQFGPVYAQIAAQSPQHAATFSAAYARNLPTSEMVSNFFARVAVAAPADRKAIVMANRENQNGIGVIHALGALPDAQALAIMKDFILGENEAVNQRALNDLAEWFAGAGQALLAAHFPLPDSVAAHDGLFDDVGNFFKGAAQTIGNAVQTVGKALGNDVRDSLFNAAHSV
jgi:hypothetical protein